MARTAKKKYNPRQIEEIDVSVFKNVQIRFPGDVYILAVWTAMSERAKSTPTCQPHTTLHGLAGNFAMLYGTDYSNPLSSEDVMAVFRNHGISGNPILRLGTTDGLLPRLPNSPIIAEKLCVLGLEAGPVPSGTSSPPGQ